MSSLASAASKRAFVVPAPFDAVSARSSTSYMHFKSRTYLIRSSFSRFRSRNTSRDVASKASRPRTMRGRPGTYLSDNTRDQDTRARARSEWTESDDSRMSTSDSFYTDDVFVGTAEDSLDELKKEKDCDSRKLKRNRAESPFAGGEKKMANFQTK
ncbi:hypothetical protein EVAR_78559_1 [Eumeta japonica]|uniref:Uncharacterized protein n=1 Tax=Eumeta variegata TaxID=151549 RepID=A0A4C1W9N3_EUMVA|nr:hypothetical protein EVAR_78559_1 [Eumeta japonica]